MAAKRRGPGGGWWRRQRRERELAEELESHIRLAVEERVRRGESRDRALAAARRELGSDVLVREVTRGVWPGARLFQVAEEARIAVRTLWRTPRYSVAAILCLSVGIGVAATMFSALHAILLRPLPYPHAAQLVALRAAQLARGESGATISPEALASWAGARSFGELGAWRGGARDLTGPEALPERVGSAEISPNLFELLGVPARHGRLFAAEEAVGGAGDVVLLGHDLWQRRFGGESGVIGARIELNGRLHEVVGVMPEGFSFPEGAALWTPLITPAGLPPNVLFYDGVLARLAAGSTVERARAEFAALVAQDLAGYEGWRFELSSLRDHLVGGLRRPVLIFQGAALLVLLLSCANVAALLLARAAARRRELAVRSAIGAGRRRLAAHVLIECGVLALAAGALGVAVAYAGSKLLTLAFPAGVPSYLDLTVPPALLLLTPGLALLTALLFGAAPALGAGRAGAESALLGAGRSAGAGGADRRRGRAVLVVAELAVSVVLLAGAVLLVRTHLALEDSLGLEPTGVLAFTVSLPLPVYPDAERRDAFHDELQERLRGLAGVVSVSASVSALPLEAAPTAGLLAVRTEPSLRAAGAERPVATGRWIAPDYLHAVGARLIAGRDVAREDARTGVVSAVANETFVRRHFPDGDVIGRRLTVESGGQAWAEPVVVVGVVRDFRHAPPPAEIAPTLYLLDRTGSAFRTFVLATSLPDPLVLAPAVRHVVRELDASLIVDRLQTQRSVLERTFWRQRLQRNVMGVFAALALLIALFGVYGVLSYSVAQRTPEFGVRLALGASGRQLLLQVVGQAARLAVVGIMLGLGATVATARLLTSLLYGVEPADPLTLAGVAATLFTVAIAAALAPARRAARLDPGSAIRR